MQHRNEGPIVSSLSVTQLDNLTMIGQYAYIFYITAVVLSSGAAGDNLALNKPANQSGAVSGTYTADRAVDGDYTPESVALPDASQVTYTDYAWWWVDLEDTYRVRNITIYNAKDPTGNPKLLVHFILSVGPHLSTLVDCGPEWIEDIPQGGHVTIPCDQVGRIVHFRRTGHGSQPYKAPLREVLVYGMEQYSCAPCPPGTPCDADTGCSQCAPGKVQSPECETDCTVGSYGLDCSHQCGQCAQPEDCSIVDGVCSGGCRTQWWIYEKCDKEIVIPNHTDETVRISEATNSSLTVTWQQIQSLDPELYEYYGYSVLYKNSTSPAYSEGPPAQHSGTGNVSTVLTGLVYYQKYSTKIIPYRTNSEEYTDGNPYPTTSANTSCGYPDPPSGVRALSSDSEGPWTILVIWKDVTAPDVRHRCESMTGLRVDFRLSSVDDWLQEYVDVTSTLHEILPLKIGEYEVRVVSSNNQNFTTISDVLIVMMPVGCSIDLTIIVIVVLVIVGVVAIVIVVTFLVLRERRQRDDQTRETNNGIIYENEAVMAEHKLNNSKSIESRSAPESIADEAKYEELDSRDQLPDPMFNFYDKIQEMPLADRIQDYHASEDIISTST